MRLSGIGQTSRSPWALWDSRAGGTRSQTGRKSARRDTGRQWHRDPGACAFSNAAAGRVTQMAIRVLLIEDHFLARMALRSVLSERNDIVIVGEASDGASGINLYRQTAPDVT